MRVSNEFYLFKYYEILHANRRFTYYVQAIKNKIKIEGFIMSLLITFFFYYKY